MPSVSSRQSHSRLAALKRWPNETSSTSDNDSDYKMDFDSETDSHPIGQTMSSTNTERLKSPISNI